MPKEHDPQWIRVQAKEALAAVRETIARPHAMLDRARKLLHEHNDSRPLHRAIAERQAERHPRPRGDQAPSPIPRASDAPPEALPAAAPPTGTGSA